MQDTSLYASATAWVWLQATTLIITGTVVVLYLLLNWLIARLAKGADSSRSRQGASLKVIRAARLVTGFFAVLTLMVVWGIDFGAVALFATTTVTLLGVALFASWSLLSNITAYFVLLFHASYSRGTFIRILETDNYVEGYVSDLSLFSLELITENKETIIYPNNLLLGRVVLVNPENRLHSVGKIVNPRDAQSASESFSKSPPEAGQEYPRP